MIFRKFAKEHANRMHTVDLETYINPNAKQLL